MIRISILCLFLFASAAGAASIPGTVVSSKITTGDTVNTFPIGDVNEMLGGPKEVANATERDAIPAERRREGMTVWVIGEQKGYRLIGGITNANWFEESFEPKNANIQAHISSTSNPHGVTTGQIGAEPANVNIQTHISNTNNPHLTTAGQIGAEPALGNPSGDGYCSKSYASGVRYWEACGTGGTSSETRTSIVQKIAETPADDSLPLIYKSSTGVEIFRVDTDTGTVTITGQMVIK